MECPYLSVVIPAYNEQDRLVNTLEKISAYLALQDYSSQVIVVSDGSTDRTAAVARGWRPAGFPLEVIDRKENRGKGYSVREGAARAGGDYVLFSDADLSTPIEDVAKLLPYLQQGFGLVIGSRNMEESELIVRQPFYRRLMGRVFNLLVRALAVPGIIDSQCGFKLFTSPALAAISPLCRIDGFSFDVEMLFIARRLGLKIKEVPVRWLNAAGSSVSPVRDSLRMFRDVCRISLNGRLGKYPRK